MKILNKLKTIYTYLQLLLFSNRIGFFNNIIHLVYSIKIKLLNILGGKEFKSVNEVVQDSVSQLRSNGYCMVEGKDNQAVEDIHKKVNAIFSDNKLCVRTLEARGLIRMRDSFFAVPEIEIFIKDAEEYIKQYFNSDFKIFSSDIYRTMQKKDGEVGFDSDLFHLDNAPQSTLKMMVYLTDVNKDTGAITVVPRSISRKLVKKGFWDRFKVDKYKKDLDDNALVVEGKKGTIILFTPQYCIHKATLPKHNHRDVAVFLIYPSGTEIVIDDGFRKQCSNYYGYLRNPFRWMPLRVGDE